MHNRCRMTCKLAVLNHHMFKLGYLTYYELSFVPKFSFFFLSQSIFYPQILNYLHDLHKTPPSCFLSLCCLLALIGIAAQVGTHIKTHTFPWVPCLNTPQTTHSPTHPPAQYLGSICWVLSLCPRRPMGLRSLPACLVCLFYDQSQLDRADGWASEAGDSLERRERGGGWGGCVAHVLESWGGGGGHCVSWIFGIYYQRA